MPNTHTKLNLILGNPVEHSLSPALHNFAYQELGLANDFVFLASPTSSEDLATVLSAFRLMQTRGLSVTIPLKVEILQYLDWVDETAKEIGAVNTVVKEANQLKGYNTDWLGIYEPLYKKMVGQSLQLPSFQATQNLPKFLQGETVGILGNGGAARSMAFAVKQAGGKICFFVRDVKKVEDLALQFAAQISTLGEVENLAKCRIIINSTPVGMWPNVDESPINPNVLQAGQVIMEAIYNPLETKLLQQAKQQNLEVISGLEMFLHQADWQFYLHTGYRVPLDKCRQFVLDLLTV